MPAYSKNYIHTNIITNKLYNYGYENQSINEYENSGNEPEAKSSENTTETWRIVSRDDYSQATRWTHTFDYIISCVGYVTNLANVWRFPYICYRNGGGAFLITFLISLLVCGAPIVLLELAFSQRANGGLVTSWKVCPLFQGIGYAMFTVAVIMSAYLNIITAWSLFMLFCSLDTELPWKECGSWSNNNCWSERKCVQMNGTWHTNRTCVLYTNKTPFTLDSPLVYSQYPSVDFFHNVVVSKTKNIFTFGTVSMQLVLCLLVAWSIVYCFLWIGRKHSRRIAYIATSFSFIVMTILLPRALALDGAFDGILYLFQTSKQSLSTAAVWGEGTFQALFSLTACWGGLITIGRVKDFTNNCLRDTVVLVSLTFMTCLFYSVIPFAVLGYMAQKPYISIADIAPKGPGLIFMTYAELMNHLPVPPFWGILTFAVLAGIGISSLMNVTKVIYSTLLDCNPHFFQGKYRVTLLAFLCLVFFFVGVIFCAQNGVYYIQLVDNYAATYSIVIIGFSECLVLSWFYGAERLIQDLHLMLGFRPSNLWKFCWQFLTPMYLTFILLVSCIGFKRSSYDEEAFPDPADAIGWLITISTVLAIPISAFIYAISRKIMLGLPWIQIVSLSVKSQPTWFLRPATIPFKNIQSQQIDSASLPLQAFPCNLCKEDRV